ncbi:hypothetical protein GCM10022267_73520 [Lentzea roselyniae]|uniref:Uncharacterized protein n=1 Tax=Lentzea roselyniae TaxID=531940 RepID=A0ABP7C0U4_9PSEU
MPCTAALAAKQKWRLAADEFGHHEITTVWTGRYPTMSGGPMGEVFVSDHKTDRLTQKWELPAA